MIKSNKEKFRKKLDLLFKNMTYYCERCKYIDCRGYLWLLPEEIKEIKSKGIDLVIINEEITFVDSFKRINKKIDPSFFQPRCKLRDNCGKCKIHEIKPLNCMLYPLSLRRINKNVYLVLNKDCFFVEGLIKEKKLNNFKQETIIFWNSLNKEFKSNYLATFKKVEKISILPKKYNKEVIKILKID